MRKLTEEQRQLMADRRDAVLQAVRKWRAAHAQAIGNYEAARGDPRDVNTQLACNQAAADAQLEEDIAAAREQQNGKLLAIEQQAVRKSNAQVGGN